MARDDVSLKGFASLPTFNRPTTANIFLFVNGRPQFMTRAFGSDKGRLWGYSAAWTASDGCIVPLYADIIC